MPAGLGPAFSGGDARAGEMGIDGRDQIFQHQRAIGRVGVMRIGRAARRMGLREIRQQEAVRVGDALGRGDEGNVARGEPV